MKAKDKKSDVNKVLDAEMIALLGKREWGTWKSEEPELYSSIVAAMLKYGEKKWYQAQYDLFNQRPNKTDFKP